LELRVAIVFSDRTPLIAAITNDSTTTMKTEIHYLSPEDYREFRQIRLEALKTDPDAFGALHADACRRTDEEWKEWVSSAIVPGRKNIVVAEENGLPIAMCGFGLSDEDPNAGFLWGMFVSRNHRRKQCGERLLREAEDWVSANGGKRITACVAAPNENAFLFYRKNGYTIGSVSGTLRSGSSIPIHPIEKPLGGLHQVTPGG
jgi:ribosomal protein S18 acetylase RimI-like enzyme